MRPLFARPNASLTRLRSIFKPSEHNSLLDLLLARGVNGESPSRANSPRRSRSRSASPNRKQATQAAATSKAAKVEKKPSRGRKSQAGRKAVEEESEEPVAGLCLLLLPLYLAICVVPRMPRSV